MAKRFKQHPEIVSVNCDVTNWAIILSWTRKKHHFLEDGNRNPYKWRGETSSNLIFSRENPAGKYEDFIVLFHIVRFIDFITSFWLDIVYTINFQCGFANRPSRTHTQNNFPIYWQIVSSNVFPRQLSVVFLDMESKSFMSKRSFGDSGFGVNHWKLTAEI